MHPISYCEQNGVLGVLEVGAGKSGLERLWVEGGGVKKKLVPNHVTRHNRRTRQTRPPLTILHR
jgi:hypothetical protein